jgi:hypothetical protein
VASSLGDPTPLGWLVLNLALHVRGARDHADLTPIADALEPRGGAASKAAALVRVLRAPPQPACAGGGDAGAGDDQGADDMQVDEAVGVVAVGDLWQTAGGRHDNDHQDFRDIEVMVTSQEVWVAGVGSRS